MTAVPVVSATLTTRTYKEFGADFPHDAERVTAAPVFVVLDQAPDLTCRECAGDGGWTDDYMREHDCPSCRGSGVSPVYAATWQTVDMPLDPHEHLGPMIYEHSDGRREPIPPPAPTVNDLFSGRRQVVEWRATKVDVVVMSDGDCGVRLDGWEHLEQPHTEMPCPRCSKRSEWCGYEEAPGVPDEGAIAGCSVGRVPLSVPDGVLSWMELAA